MKSYGCCPDLPTPEISPSFSSCIVRKVLVMSMDDMDRSSLSVRFAGSEFVTVTFDCEKPEKKKKTLRIQLDAEPINV